MHKPPDSRAAALPSGTVDMPHALGGHATLAALLGRVQASQARLKALEPLLPAPMRPHLAAGPLDDEGWTLLAGNAAVAAKLRQMLPALAARLANAGFDARPVRIKLAAPR